MAADAAIHDFPNRNKGVDAGFAGMTVEAPPKQEPVSMPLGISYHLLRGPAKDETCATVSRSADGEIGQSMVRSSPRISWIRGTSSTPNCAMDHPVRERVV